MDCSSSSSLPPDTREDSLVIFASLARKTKYMYALIRTGYSYVISAAGRTHEKKKKKKKAGRDQRVSLLILHGGGTSLVHVPVGQLDRTLDGWKKETRHNTRVRTRTGARAHTHTQPPWYKGKQTYSEMHERMHTRTRNLDKETDARKDAYTWL